MRAARGLLLAFLLVIGALAIPVVGSFLSEGDADPARPDIGVLAPLPPSPPEEEAVLRLAGGSGPVQDVAASGEILAVLTTEEWFIKDGESLRGGFGDPNPGAPNWLARPVSIAVAAGRVYILDAGRFVLSVWDTAGRRLEDVRLPPGEDTSYQPTQVVVGPGDEPVVVSFHLGRDGVARWEARGHRGEPGRALFVRRSQAPFAVYERPILARHGDELLAMNALDHSVFRVDSTTADPVPHLRRAAPPLWRVAERIRQSHNSMLRGFGGGPGAAVSGLPGVWPSVRDFTIAGTGSMLVAVSAGEDRQHVEMLDGTGVPRWRFSADGFLEPVFLDDGRVFLVRENLSETVIYELVVREE